MKRTYWISALTFAACFGMQTLSANPIPSVGSRAFINELPQIGALPQAKPFQLRPIATASAFGGTNISGEAQGLLPILGDMNRVFFAEAETHITNDTSHKGWMLGGGLGYRQVIGNNIFGGYFITNYNNSPQSHHFFTGNLGLELLGKAWDFRTNIYTPLETHKKEWLIKRGWAEEDFDIDDYVEIDGHTIFDHMMSRFEEIGTGVDAEVGKTLPFGKGLKAYAGGYYFHYHLGEDIKGAEARVTYELNRYLSLEAVDSFDTYRHNTFLVGFKVTLGGFTQSEKNTLGMTGRLLDPIEHDFAAINSGITEPIIIVDEDEGQQVATDNAWFFKEPETRDDIHFGAGTTEDPIIGVDQYIIDFINNHPTGVDDPYLFFANRTKDGDISQYYLNDSSIGTPPFPTLISIPDDFHLFGRNETFLSNVYGDDRPIFVGALDLGNDTELMSMRFHNDSEPGNAHAAAIFMAGVSNIDIDNIQVGTGDEDATDYKTSVTVTDGNNINIEDSQFYAYSNNNAAYGFHLDNTSLPGTLTFTNNSFDIKAATLQAYGFYDISSSTNSLTFSGDTFIVNALNHEAYGFYAPAHNQFTINDLILDVTGNGSNAYGLDFFGSVVGGDLTITNLGTSYDYSNIINTGGNAYGIYYDNTAPEKVLINNSYLNVEGDLNAYGIKISDFFNTAFMTVNTSTFDVLGNTNVYGIAATNLSYIVLDNSTLNVDNNNNSGETAGINLDGFGAGDLTIRNDSEINVGTLVHGGQNAYGIKTAASPALSSISIKSGSTIQVNTEGNAYGIQSNNFNYGNLVLEDSTFDIYGDLKSYGIDLGTINTITLTNTTFNVDNDSGEDIFGINIKGIGLPTSKLTIEKGSEINVGVGDSAFNAYGIKVDSGALKTIDILANGGSRVNMAVDSLINAYGIKAPAATDINIDTADIDVTARFGNVAYGLDLFGSGAGGSLTINNLGSSSDYSEITNGDGEAYGIAYSGTVGPDTFSITNSYINVNGETNTYGIKTANSVLTIDQVYLNVISNGAYTAYGIHMPATETATIDNSHICAGCSFISPPTALPNTSNKGEGIHIDGTGAGSLTINNSDIRGYGKVEAYGIYSKDSSGEIITITRADIWGYLFPADVSSSTIAAAIYLEAPNTILSITENTDLYAYNAKKTYGIYIPSSTNVTMKKSSIKSITEPTLDDSSYAFGIYIFGTTPDVELDILNTNFNVQINEALGNLHPPVYTDMVNAYGIYSEANFASPVTPTSLINNNSWVYLWQVPPDASEHRVVEGGAPI